MKKERAQINIENNLYCSLDIETSDFDPSVGEILELGMVFFKINNNKIVQLKEWTSTFFATREVPSRILALTGISNQELQLSPKFSEKSSEIQDLVKDAIILGHNINFDIRFLEAFGIKFSGKKVDTLDLAQIILPTNISYNLEALMNFFDIHYKDAHRALSDARASILVFEKMLAHLSSFSDSLRLHLSKLMRASDLQLAELFSTDIPALAVAEKFKKLDTFLSPEIYQSLQLKNTVLTFPLGFNYYGYIYGVLQKLKKKTLLVVPNSRIMYQIWKSGIAQPVLDNSDLFNVKRFEKVLKKKLDPDTTKFLAKILIWKESNWQSKSLIDLNLSFFGNQFRNEINYGKQKKQKLPDSAEKVLVTDYLTFIQNDFKNFTKRKIIILDLNNFESTLTYASSGKISWGDLLYSLKQISVLGSAGPKLQVQSSIQQILADVDLFFGLASLGFQKIERDSQNILITRAISDSENFKNVERAAFGFIDKLEKFNLIARSEKIENQIEALKDFFKQGDKKIRWVEVSEGRFTFMISPLNLDDIAKEKLGPFKDLIFSACLGSEALVNYFVRRMAIKDFLITNIGQQELSRKFQVEINPSLNDPNKFLGLISQLEAPAAVLLGNMASVKEFYENNYDDLQKKVRIFAQGYSGGTTKILENFSISEKSLLLATDKFILKQIGRKLRVKNLVITRLPFERFNHPLLAVQAEQYQNKFEEFSIPRALYNFHSLINFFLNPDLEHIYITDQKINKEYGKYFIDYLKSLPFVKINYQ